MSFYDECFMLYCARFVSPDRKIKLQFIVQHNQPISEILALASSEGLNGAVLLLEEDGTQICSDHLVTLYVRKGHTFMVANDYEEWQPRTSRRKRSQVESAAVEELKLQLKEVSDKLKKIEDDSKA